MGVPESLRFTYEDYLLTPDDRRYELVDGDLLLTPAPTPYHQQIAGELFARLREFVRGQRLGELLFAPCDVVLSRHDVVQPDILFVRSDRLSIIGQQNITGAPDLVVEILSPGTEDRDRTMKSKLYARSGVRELWIVDPSAKTIEVFTASGAALGREAVFGPTETLRTSILPGLEIPLARVF
jgi:Uma2 family endonuclease